MIHDFGNHRETCVQFDRSLRNKDFLGPCQPIWAEAEASVELFSSSRGRKPKSPPPAYPQRVYLNNILTVQEESSWRLEASANVNSDSESESSLEDNSVGSSSSSLDSEAEIEVIVRC